MSTNVHEFTDENFDSDVAQSDLPVLIDFWARFFFLLLSHENTRTLFDWTLFLSVSV